MRALAVSFVCCSAATAASMAAPYSRGVIGASATCQLPQPSTMTLQFDPRSLDMPRLCAKLPFRALGIIASVLYTTVSLAPDGERRMLRFASTYTTAAPFFVLLRKW